MHFYKNQNFGMTANRLPQRGVSLFIVIIFVMLSMLLALWATRTSFFNELLTSNDADYQRAFEAAQALLQDAELDIRGELSDGSACKAAPCRAYTNKLQFPADSKEINPLILALEAQATHCQDALCVRRLGRQDFWNYADATTTVRPIARTDMGEVPLSALKAVGARYGQYTGASNKTTNGPINPILTETHEERGGWYWIEVMRYTDAAKSANLIIDSNTNQLPLHLDVYVIYRITALAMGRKEGTMAVLQQTYARQRQRD